MIVLLGKPLNIRSGLLGDGAFLPRSRYLIPSQSDTNIYLQGTIVSPASTSSRVHTVWKTWNFKKIFSSQGSRGNGNFGQILEKSGKYVNLYCLQSVMKYQYIEKTRRANWSKPEGELGNGD